MSTKNKEKELETESKTETKPETETKKESIKQKNNKLAKKKGKDAEKKPNIPNTLTIFIKTIIPNHTKILYEPFMTVPTSKSHTVYFDPLVKYIKGAITDIPKNAPPYSKYTQFFEANQFDSFINRCISKTFNIQKNPLKLLNLQKERTLDQAMKEDLINQNIKLTLSSLFKPNGLFYINKRPYTILGKKWKNNDWSIDIKPSDKLRSPYTNLSYKNAMKEAEDELKLLATKYPDAVGEVNTKNTETINDIKNGVTYEKKPEKLSQEKEYLSEVFEDEEHYITPNYPIIFANEPDLNTDPITFSLLLDRAEFAKFVEENKSKDNDILIAKFGRYLEFKKILYENKNDYNDTQFQIGIIQKQYDRISKAIFDILVFKNDDSPSDPEEINDLKKQLSSVPGMCEELLDYQVQIMKLVLELSNKLIQLYENQRNYFNAIVDFLKEYKKIYTRSIDYYKDKAELVDMCIDADIRVYELLSAEIPKNNENENCDSYCKSIKSFKNKLKVLSKEEEYLRNTNISELIQMYVDNPFLLISSKKQLTIYYYTVSMSYNVNQLYIWKIYYGEIEKLVIKTIQYYFEMMQKTISFKNVNKDITYENLKKNYPNFSGIKLETNIIKAGILKWVLNKPDTSELEWKLVDDNDIPIIPDTDKTKLIEKKYIELFKLESDLYDCIILITHLLQIKCLRQNSLYIAEQNVTNNDLMMLKSYFVYYCSLLLFEVYQGDNEKTKEIFKMLEDIDHTYMYDLSDPDIDRSHYKDLTDYTKTGPFNRNSINIEIPPSILLESKKMKQDTALILSQIENIYGDIFIQKNKSAFVGQILQSHIKSCDEFKKLLHLKMSEKGIEDQCNKLLDGFNVISDITQLVTMSYFDKEINTENIDVDMTIKFNNAVMNTAKTKLRTTSYFFQEWVIYKKNTDTKSQIYNCIKDILNKQLDRLNAITINLYTDLDVKSGLKQFTIDSLKKMFYDNYNEQEKKSVIDVFKDVLDINIYIVEIDAKTNTVAIKPNNYNPLLTNNENIIFLFLDSDGYFHIIGNYEGICMFDYKKIKFFNLLYYQEETESETGGPSELEAEEPPIKQILKLQPTSTEDITGSENFSEVSEAENLEAENLEAENLEAENENGFIKANQIVSKLTSNKSLQKLINTLDDLKEKINPERKSKSGRIIQINPDTLSQTNREILDTERKIKKKVNEIISNKELEEINRYFEKFIPIILNTLTTFTELGNLKAKDIKQYLATLIELEYRLDLINKIKQYTDIIKNPALIYLNDLNDIEITEIYTDINAKRDEMNEIISKLVANEVIAKKILALLKIDQKNIDQKKKDEFKFMKGILDKYITENINFLEDSELKNDYDAIIRQLEREEINNIFSGGSSIEINNDDSDGDEDDEFVSAFFGGARERPSKEYYNYAQQNMPYPMQGFYGQPPLRPPLGPYPPVMPGYPPVMPGYPPVMPGYPPATPVYPQEYPQGYPPATPVYPQVMPGYPPVSQGYPPYTQQNLDYYNYNFQYNFAKENKSKLSYYITIELELYPGTEVSAIKKYSMKCNNTFERIRKSLSELFGYQYRPRELKEAYEYEANFEANEKLKEEQEKKKEEDKKEKEREEKEKEQEKEKKGGKLNKSIKKIKRSKNKTLKKIK